MSPPPSQSLHSPPVTIVLTVVLLIFFLLGFFSIYFCRCLAEALLHSWPLRRTPSGAGSGVNPARSGLDPAAVKSLPTFLYSAVKDVRREKKYALECAICLVEFADDSLLRLLSACYHVFHRDCIDHWLASHKTCPVCRRTLDSAAPDNNNNNNNNVRIDIDVNDNDNDNENDNDNNSDNNVDNDDDDALETVRPRGRRRFRSGDVWREGFGGDAGRFTRSHSTGHSIVRLRRESEEEEGEEEEEERYTLRLPEQVRERILRARRWAASCEAYGCEWDHLALHRFIVSSNYGSPVSSDDDNSGALVADPLSRSDLN